MKQVSWFYSKRKLAKMPQIMKSFDKFRTVSKSVVLCQLFQAPYRLIPFDEWLTSLVSHFYLLRDERKGREECVCYVNEEKGEGGFWSKRNGSIYDSLILLGLTLIISTRLNIHLCLRAFLSLNNASIWTKVLLRFFLERISFTTKYFR